MNQRSKENIKGDTNEFDKLLASARKKWKRHVKEENSEKENKCLNDKEYKKKDQAADHKAVHKIANEIAVGYDRYMYGDKGGGLEVGELQATTSLPAREKKNKGAGMTTLYDKWKNRGAGAGETPQLSAEVQDAMANRNEAVAGAPPRVQSQPAMASPQAPMPQEMPTQTSQRPMQAVEQEPSGLPLQDEVQSILGAQKQYLSFATKAQQQFLEQARLKQYGV